MVYCDFHIQLTICILEITNLLHTFHLYHRLVCLDPSVYIPDYYCSLDWNLHLNTGCRSKMDPLCFLLFCWLLLKQIAIVKLGDNLGNSLHAHCSPNRSSSVSTSENFIWNQPEMYRWAADTDQLHFIPNSTLTTCCIISDKISHVYI